MEIELKNYQDKWQEVKDSTMTTIGLNKGSYPSSTWKKKLLLSEHSPIRAITFNWKWIDIKYWVSVHFVRHSVGITHLVKTQRTDRTSVSRDELPQSSLVNHQCIANAQTILNISRKRLCMCASTETRNAWILVKEEISKVEPELASCMVRECVYRGFCPEVFGCGFDKTEKFKEEVEHYRNDFITE